MIEDKAARTTDQPEKLSLIREALKRDSRFTLVAERKEGQNGAGPAEVVDIYVAPQEPSFSPQTLQQELKEIEKLIPLRPDRQEQFRPRGEAAAEDLTLGKLIFDEEIGDGKTRRTLVRLYPAKEIAQAVVEAWQNVKKGETDERIGLEDNLTAEQISKHFPRFLEEFLLGDLLEVLLEGETGLSDSEKLPIGWPAKDFSLKGTDEKTYSLADFTGKKGLLLVFSCNHCPYARAAWPLLVKLHQKYGNEVSFVAINPNDEETYPEDSFAEMVKKQKEWGIPFAYLRDKTQETARIYKAQCTPDPYLFKAENGELRLFYRGRINDNWQRPEVVKERNLEEAVEKLLKGETPPASQPASMGCSIKWKDENRFF